MTIKSATIIDKIYNQNLLETFILSNSTVTGEPGAIIHCLKFYNLLAWENSFDLNQIYKDLMGQFRFRPKAPQTFNDIVEMGIFVGAERLEGGKRIHTILVYDMDKGSRISNIRILAKHDLELGAEVTLGNVYIDRFANIWAILTNQTLNMYAIVPHPPRYEDSVVILDGLYLKKAFFFDKDPVTANLPFLSFGLFIDIATPEVGDKLVTFFGNNTMAVYRYVRGSADIKRMLVLPLYYGEVDEDHDLGITYQFVQSDDIVFSRYKNDLMLILLKRLSGSTQVGFSIFVYDIRRNKLGSLLMKVHLSQDIEFSQNFARMEIIANDDESDIRIYLYTGAERVLQYRLKYTNEIQISKSDRETLTKHCAKSDVDLHYEINPETDPKQKAHIIIRALNTGLAIINK